MNNEDFVSYLLISFTQAMTIVSQPVIVKQSDMLQDLLITSQGISKSTRALKQWILTFTDLSQGAPQSSHLCRNTEV